MGFCDSQKSPKDDITYFCERTGRIFREDIVNVINNVNDVILSNHYRVIIPFTIKVKTTKGAF